MYYRLNDAYALRGWLHLTNALLKRPENAVKPLTGSDFNLLLLCDGCTSMDGLLTDATRTRLDKYVADGIVTPSETAAPIDKDQQYRFYRNRFVPAAHWAITGRCNYRCRHCYMDAPSGQYGELSHEDAFDIIEQLSQCGIQQIELTGGEPFIRNDFWEIVDEIRRRKMVIRQVYTNAWLLNDAILDEFEHRGMRPEFSVSFDGIGWHDWMRGVTGAEDAAWRAFALCKRRGFNVNVEMCLHTGNIPVVRESLKKLGEAGVHAVKIGAIRPTPLWESRGEGRTVSNEDYIEAAIDYIPHYCEDGKPLDLIWSSVMLLNRNGTYMLAPERMNGEQSCESCMLCNAVRSTFHITPEGRLLPCIALTALEDQSMFPRIQDVGLQSLLTSGSYIDFATAHVGDLLKVNRECAACEHRYVCGGGCRASALLNGKGMMGCDPDQCAFFSTDYSQRIHQIAQSAGLKRK